MAIQLRDVLLHFIVNNEDALAALSEDKYLICKAFTNANIRGINDPDHFLVVLLSQKKFYLREVNNLEIIVSLLQKKNIQAFTQKTSQKWKWCHTFCILNLGESLQSSGVWRPRSRKSRS